MLELWTAFFSRKVDDYFWDIWEQWAGLFAVEEDCSLDRVLAEGEAGHLIHTLNKLRDMVLCPNMFSLAIAVSHIMTALPVVTFCFGAKTEVTLEYHNLLKNLLTPGTTNLQATQVNYLR